eukprot:TRINITY_DN4578_c0_g1_i1.p1 TRINITY_DN4578_c0_g1~~TRINITY_DN4578_c0_g1_i1.p1  ORF type:complete len:293 (-),score=85.26 TRINITY_DN4578_c0_g1_i1:70-948(-)
MTDLPSEIRFLQDDRDNSDIRRNDSGDEGDEDHEGHEHNETGDCLTHVDHPDQMLAEEPVIRRGGNTGVKGVLADYADAKRQMQVKREEERIQAEERLKNLAITVKSEKKIEEEDEEEDDDEFMREYRLKRMRELVNLQSQRPTFGFLKSIDSSEYIDTLDKEHKDVFVLLHLYQNYVPACVRLNLILQNLAIKYPFVKFVKMVATEANDKYEDIGLPSLLVYKAGELQHRWVPLTSRLGSDFDSGDVELLLSKSKIIQSNLIEKGNIILKSRQENEYDDDFDDVDGDSDED